MWVLHAAEAISRGAARAHIQAVAERAAGRGGMPGCQCWVSLTCLIYAFMILPLCSMPVPQKHSECITPRLSALALQGPHGASAARRSMMEAAKQLNQQSKAFSIVAEELGGLVVERAEGDRPPTHLEECVRKLVRLCSQADSECKTLSRELLLRVLNIT